MTPSTALLLRIAPVVFVLLWSTGWLAAAAAAPHADPLTFLGVRFFLTALVLLAFGIAAGVAWPFAPRDLAHLAISGVLIHALYLGGVWWAVANGVPAAISGLIAAIQPILTAMLAPALLGETITLRQWAGIGLGFAGIAVTLSPRLAGLDGDALAAATLALGVNAVGMVSVTLGTFYQKRFIAAGDLRATTALQYVFASAAALAAAAALEPMRLTWNAVTVATMAWSVFGLSIGAIGLLLLLIRHGAVSRAATLIYLIPPVVAIEAVLLFGERLSLMQAAGIALTAAGVALAVRR